MTFFGIIFIACTTLILLMKAENTDEDSNTGQSPSETFRQLWHILKQKPMQKLIGLLLTWKVTKIFVCLLLCIPKINHQFGKYKIGLAIDSLITVKMLEAGVHRETLSLITVPFQLIQIVISMSIAKCIPTARPLDFFHKIYPIKLLLTGALLSWLHEATGLKLAFLFVYAVLNSLNSLLLSLLIVTKGSFFAQISDRGIGATYMTLLHTISNIGC
jgi:PAT family acetyl-CoA transporter-like MFS transporter 1